MNKIYAFIAIMICAIPFGSQAQSQRFEGTAVENSKQPSLDKIFTKYSLFRINTEAVAAYTQATASMGSYITLDLLQYASFPLYLHQRDILSHDYRLRAGTAEGIQTLPRPACMTYEGWQTNKGRGRATLTITNTLLHGTIRDKDKEYFIEPLRYLKENVDEDIYVVYETADVIPIPGNPCGLAEVNERKETIPDGSTANKGTGTATGTCRMVEMAIASDDSMYNRFKTVIAVQEHNIAIMNLMVETYSNAQIGPRYLEFKIVGQYVATTFAANPQSPNYPGHNCNTILNSFRTWGQVPANFGVTFDLAQLWTTKDIGSYLSSVGPDTTYSTGVVGLAFLSASCQSIRYQLIEKFTSGAVQASVVSHETGHNLNAAHDASGAPFIMAPSVANPPNTTFSPASLSSMDAWTGGSGGTCFSACNAAAPIAEFNGSVTRACTNNAVTFTSYSVGQVTSQSWQFPGANITSSTSVSQTVNYSTPGLKSITLTVTSSAGTTSKTKTFFVGNPATAPCSAGVGGCGANETGLMNVRLSDLSYSPSPIYIDGSYDNLSCIENLQLIAGTTYQAQVRLGFPGQTPAITAKGAMYLDYNNDGDFSGANELLHEGTICREGTYYNFQFTTPASVPVTNTWLTLRAVARTCSSGTTGGCNIGCGNVLDFSAYFAGAAAPLPVTLINFTGQRKNDGNELNWMMASNSNVDYFVLERSTDGVSFGGIDHLVAKPATKEVQEYRVTDKFTNETKNLDKLYYRLKIISTDGESQYSAVIILQPQDETNGGITLYPNPAERGNILHLKLDGTSNTEIDMFNNLGQRVYTTHTLPGQQSIGINLPTTWTAGIYFIKVRGAEKVYTRTIMIR